jgi:hypothetical protein
MSIIGRRAAVALAVLGIASAMNPGAGFEGQHHRNILQSVGKEGAYAMAPSPMAMTSSGITGPQQSVGKQGAYTTAPTTMASTSGGRHLLYSTSADLNPAYSESGSSNRSPGGGSSSPSPSGRHLLAVRSFLNFNALASADVLACTRAIPSGFKGPKSHSYCHDLWALRLPPCHDRNFVYWEKGWHHSYVIDCTLTEYIL